MESPLHYLQLAVVFPDWQVGDGGVSSGPFSGATHDVHALEES